MIFTETIAAVVDCYRHRDHAMKLTPYKRNKHAR